MSNFRIGWAEANITPDKKVSLIGQFADVRITASNTWALYGELS